MLVTVCLSVVDSIRMNLEAIFYDSLCVSAPVPLFFARVTVCVRASVRPYL